MSETVKNGDFIELEYTASLKESGAVFDTTNLEIAKKEELYDAKMSYGPVSICIGEGQILKGLDSALEDIEIGSEKELLLGPENAFGKKDAKLMKLVPTSVFKKEGIRPMTGLQVNIDGMIGTIRNVSGGRTIVDFNHPFSGKEVVYKVKIFKKITDDADKVKALLHLGLNMKPEAIGVKITDGKCTITLAKEFDKQLLDILKERVKKVLPIIKELEFANNKNSNNTNNNTVNKTENNTANNNIGN